MYNFFLDREQTNGGGEGGAGGGGRANDRPGTDHLTSRPMRGLKKTAPDGADTQTGHRSQTDMATL